MRFLLCTILCLFANIAWAAPGDLKVYGKDAPTKLYLFTSLTCVHCATFHNKVLPDLIKKYVDTGKAQLTIVDFVTSPNGLFATAAIRCSDGKKTEYLEDNLYANQRLWIRETTDTAKEQIARFASLQGISKTKLEACFADQEMQQKMLDSRRNLVSLYNISSTPTLLVRKGSQINTFIGSNKEEIEQELDEILKK